MIKDDVLTENELLVLKSVLKDLTVRNKKSALGLSSLLRLGANAQYEAQETALIDTYNKIENLNKFLIEQLGG